MAIGMGGLGTLSSMSGLGPHLELCSVEVEQATLGGLPTHLASYPYLNELGNSWARMADPRVIRHDLGFGTSEKV